MLGRLLVRGAGKKKRTKKREREAIECRKLRLLPMSLKPQTLAPASHGVMEPYFAKCISVFSYHQGQRDRVAKVMD